MGVDVRELAKQAMFRLPLRWSRAIRYRFHAGRWPRIADPRGLNEKVNWLILFAGDTVEDWTCDKLAAKERAAELSPGILLPEVLWVGTDPAELSRLSIDGRWILKPNGSSQNLLHGSGQPDGAEVRRALSSWQTDFQWRVNGERAYERARPVAILERWIADAADPPPDYKVLVFHGTARYVHAHTRRFRDHRSSVYSRDWTWLPDVRQRHIRGHLEPLPPPPHLDELLRRAEQIAGDTGFMRVDLYDTEEGVWFGETTPYAWSGMRPYLPDAFELELGSYWTLPDLPGRRVLRRAVG